MLKRRIFLLIVCFAVLSVIAVPAMGLIQFSAHNLGMYFEGNIFYAYDIFNSFAILTRDVDPVGNVVFDGPIASSEFFSLEMTLENITLYTATATGELTITDLDGDTIAGDITGSWALVGGYPYFYGTLSDVQVTTDDNEFNGTDGSFIPLSFPSNPPPWIGAAIGLTTDSAPWFSNDWTESEEGGGITGWFVPFTLKADINSDNKVNLVDFAILAGQWRQAPGQQSADIYPSGGDGIVNLLDLGVLCDYWLEGTEP